MNRRCTKNIMPLNSIPAVNTDKHNECSITLMFVGRSSHSIGFPFFTEFVGQRYKKENICVKQVLRIRLY